MVWHLNSFGKMCCRSEQRRTLPLWSRQKGDSGRGRSSQHARVQSAKDGPSQQQGRAPPKDAPNFLKWGPRGRAHEGERRFEMRPSGGTHTDWFSTATGPDLASPPRPWDPTFSHGQPSLFWRLTIEYQPVWCAPRGDGMMVKPVNTRQKDGIRKALCERDFEGIEARGSERGREGRGASGRKEGGGSPLLLLRLLWEWVSEWVAPL